MKFIQSTQLVLGIWILVSPWILGYASLAIALWGSIIVGAFVALLALWALFGTENKKPDKE